MATVYYPQFDVVRIDANGVRIPVTSATINVYNVTAAASLGTVSSDASGVVVEGTKTATAGDVIELSHGTYPLTQRLTLQATQELAYLAPENDIAAYVAENLHTQTTNSRMAELWAQDIDNPDTAPFFLGMGKAGETTQIQYQSNVEKNLRIFPIAIDEKLNRQRLNFDTDNYEDVAIPALEVGGGSSALLFSHSADRTTITGIDQEILYSDIIPAGTLANNLDAIEIKYSGVFAATNAGTILTVSFTGAILATDLFDTLELDSTSWEITVSIVRKNNTTIRTSVTLSTPGVDPIVKYTEVASLNLTSTDYTLILYAEAAIGHVTAKMGLGRYVAAAPIPEFADITGIWAAYEASSYDLIDGDNAGNWTDGTGNGRTATVTNTPTFETNEINGESIIRVGGNSNDYFTLPSMAGFTSGAMVEVIKVTDITTSGGHDFGSSSDASHYPHSGGAANIYDDFGSTVRKGILTSLVTISGTWHVVYRWSAASDWGLMQNYATVHTTGTNTVGFQSSPRIGYNLSTYMKADIAAVYIFNVKPTAAALAKLRHRIESKFGL